MFTLGQAHLGQSSVRYAPIKTKLAAMGFNNALEPCNRCADSHAVPTQQAIEILDVIGVDEMMV
jgi:hypothetical protein